MKVTTINLLNELRKEEFSSFLSEFHERSFGKQSIIFEPECNDFDSNEPAFSGVKYFENSCVFIVKTGRVRVYLAFGGKEFTIATLEPGDVFSSHSSAFVQALEETTLLIIDTAIFKKRILHVPEFTLSVVRVLGGMLKNSFSIIDGLALHDATARLAKFLLESARNEPIEAVEKKIVRITISGEMLAQSLGASRQTISTLLSDFIRSGILEKKQRGVYCILAPERLREMLI